MKKYGPFIAICLVASSTVGLLFFGLPMWYVWKQGLSGEAVLAKAEQERRIIVEQARAEMEAAQLRAEAIEIVGAAAQQYPEYRYQEFMGAFAEALQSESIDKIVFIPTEANIPIVEAGRTVTMTANRDALDAKILEASTRFDRNTSWGLPSINRLNAAVSRAREAQRDGSFFSRQLSIEELNRVMVEAVEEGAAERAAS